MENNTEKKKNTATATMAVISVIIIALGVICAAALYSALSGEIARGEESQLIVQGFDLVAISGKAGKAGAFVLSALTVAASFLLAAVQWIGYAIVCAVKNLLKNKD